MQGADKGNHQIHHEDDTHFEIADFRETLSKCIEDDNKVYGRKNKPRDQEPTMFNLLSWQDKDESQWDFTKKDKSVVDANIVNHLKYKINKANSPWVTENMDQFRKFTYSPTKKAVFFDLEDPTKGRPSASKGAGITQELAHLGKSPKGKEGYMKELPAKASESLDRYAIKDLKNLKDVLKVIENRAIDKGGDLIANPIAHQLTDHYGYEDEEDGVHRDHCSDEEHNQRRGDEDSSDEDVKVDKANYTNVQSRLLTNKVRKAKELDPFYEKDRLKRRTDRIQKLNETTRWLPNTSFKTYFGKAPFENYGRGNINPSVGGPIYGDYMKSHNINPHAGGNKPEYKQIYDRAELAATTYPDNEPEPPRKCKDEHRLSQKQVEDLKRRNPRVPEKFSTTSKNIIKPDLVNSMRFASEENTPDNSFEEKAKSSKPKNLGESLKALSKTTKAIRKDIVKNSPTLSAKKNKSAKNKKQEQLYRQTQELLRQENQKAASARKEAPEAARQQEVKRGQPQSESKKGKTQAKTSAPQGKERTKQHKGHHHEEYDVAEDFDFSRGKASTANQQAQQRGKSNDSKGVKDLMNDPLTSFNETLRTKGKVEVDNKSPKKEVSFKQGASGSKYREAPSAQQHSHKDPQDYGQVEHLQTLLKDTHKNDNLWNKVNEDMNGTQNVNAMNPPKNYLFSLAQKETDPRYYKNVPAVWLNRIPYAGKKIEKCEDIKGVFNP